MAVSSPETVILVAAAAADYSVLVLSLAAENRVTLAVPVFRRAGGLLLAVPGALTAADLDGAGALSDPLSIPLRVDGELGEASEEVAPVLLVDWTLLDSVRFATDDEAADDGTHLSVFASADDAAVGLPLASALQKAAMEWLLGKGGELSESYHTAPEGEAGAAGSAGERGPARKSPVRRPAKGRPPWLRWPPMWRRSAAQSLRC